MVDTEQIVPGYEVLERIGAGGYGEVFRARAPGGLEKAIKVVFGRLDGRRAMDELRALNRVKAVRHPFLLSLERIEVSENRLAIVTELADRGLDNRFAEAVAAGGRGVPREELLGYLREVADVLDFMSEEHGLQHLDIKPENLLLVGAHVKVSDFGLVKSLDAASVSMVGGLTPAYAAPEVFDGKPSRQSDQYSLAIVYQQMLTGRMPFRGETIAQLATQHLTAPPTLDVLPEEDRGAVARALSKDPAARFASCREFVAALGQSSRKSPPERSGRPEPIDDREAEEPLRFNGGAGPELGVGNVTAVIDIDFAPPAKTGEAPETDRASRRDTPLIDAAPAPRWFPPRDFTDNDAGLRPTLYVGVGGCGVTALLELRGRLENRYGRQTPIPALRMLALDVDRQFLAEAVGGQFGVSLEEEETLALPLRTAAEYRERAESFSHWLSRRWIYNIPRSGKTEGLRPLGRLALADHHEAVLGALRRHIAALRDKHALRLSAKATGLSVRSMAPRIVVVASANGGAGGGMALELAQLARRELAEDGADAGGEVVLALAHSASREPGARQLAIGNTLATLLELKRYFRGGAPADPSCGLPQLAPGESVFRSAWLIPLGDVEGESEGAETVAEFLCRETLSPAAAWFPPVADGVPDVSEPTISLVRSVAWHTQESRSVRIAARRLAAAALRQWSGAPDATDTASASGSAAADAAPVGQVSDLPASLGPAGCKPAPRRSGPSSAASPQERQVADELQLDLQAALKLAYGLAEKEFRSELDALSRMPDPQEFFEKADSLFGQFGREGQFPPELSNDSRWRKVEERLCDVALENLQPIRDKEDELLADPNYRLEGYRRLVALLRRRAEAAEGRLRRLFDEADEELARGREQLLNPETPRGAEFSRKLARHAVLRLYAVSLPAARRMFENLRGGLEAIESRLKRASRSLERLADSLSGDASRVSSEEPAAAGQDWLELAPELVDGLCEQLDGPILAGENTTAAALADSQRVKPLGEVLLREAERALLRAALGRRVTEGLLPPPATRGASGLLFCVTGEEAPALRQAAQALFDPAPSFATDARDASAIFCLTRAPLSDVLAVVSEGRDDYFDIAARVHTRQDVQ